ncbi:hypothetical protein Q4F19_13535 [Sphingomonas sp. BIUV-7]|uniref:Uncharacterized protein n=1 Tax=Sphingomonas natans TaxID=3063330 RepID=A0ABT8YCI8_9SPHN|nr:hypothetical protein [Sphingomonas sp. BIUV-7]MDO6415409.1 hypothetical protein [Sphingomonas sp. BIUV-7]
MTEELLLSTIAIELEALIDRLDGVGKGILAIPHMTLALDRLRAELELIEQGDQVVPRTH